MSQSRSDGMRVTGGTRSAANARGEASRKRILDASTEVLRERGYAGLSIAAVCDRAQLAPTSVYWHFGSKAGLMEAVLAHVGDQHAARIQLAATSGQTREEQLAALLEEIRRLVESQPLGSLTGVAVVAEGRHVTPELLAGLRSARDRERADIANAYRSELGTSSRRARALAIVSTAIANYAAICYRLGEDDTEVDEILEALAEMLRLADQSGSQG